jgi:hypothetical protein
MAKADRFYIDLGSVKYGFAVRKDSYKGIAAALGIKEVKNNTKGVVYGANSPKPKRVRITTANGKTYQRFIDGNKIKSVTVDNSLKGKSFKGSKIERVS